MLPYSPLHHLLLADAGATLVMTSGNVSDEPIAFDDEDARRAARRHRGPVPGPRPADRDPHRRLASCAWSAAARCCCGARAATCRDRCGCPWTAARHLLACGAELKNTFARGQGRHAPGWATTSATSRTTRRCARSRPGSTHFQRLFAVAPEVVAHDLHPDYLSTKYALELDGVRARRRAAPPRPPRGLPRRARRDRPGGRGDLRRHRVRRRTARCGAASCWSATCAASSGPGFLFPVRMPGGEAAIRQPWRMACAWLAAARGAAAAPPPLAGWSTRPPGRRCPRWCASGVASPLTTSVGRLFDAVAALCGVRAEVNYEGQAAVELEAVLRSRPRRGAYPLPLLDDGARRS